MQTFEEVKIISVFFFFFHCLNRFTNSNEINIFYIFVVLQLTKFTNIDVFLYTCVTGMQNNQSALSLFTMETTGGIIDDFIITKISNERLFLISNASQKIIDKQLLSLQLVRNCNISHRFKRINFICVIANCETSNWSDNTQCELKKLKEKNINFTFPFRFSGNLK